MKLYEMVLIIKPIMSAGMYNIRFLEGLAILFVDIIFLNTEFCMNVSLGKQMYIAYAYSSINNGKMHLALNKMKTINL